VQPEFAVDRLELGRFDQLAMGQPAPSGAGLLQNLLRPRNINFFARDEFAAENTQVLRRGPTTFAEAPSPRTRRLADEHKQLLRALGARRLCQSMRRFIAESRPATSAELVSVG